MLREEKKNGIMKNAQLKPEKSEKIKETRNTMNKKL